MAPFTVFGLLAPLVAGVGLVLVLLALVSQQSPDARRPGVGFTVAAVGTAGLVLASLQTVLGVEVLLRGHRWSAGSVALSGASLAVAVVALLSGLRLLGRGDPRLAMTFLLLPLGAVALFLLPTRVLPLGA